VATHNVDSVTGLMPMCLQKIGHVATRPKRYHVQPALTHLYAAACCEISSVAADGLGLATDH
jgi:hypothetical protein